MAIALRTVFAWTIATLACLPCFGADIVFFDLSANPPPSGGHVLTAAQFYGLTVARYSADKAGDLANALREVREPETVAAVISADALPLLNRDEFVRTSPDGASKNVPVIVVDVREQTRPEALLSWSAGAISGCQGEWKTTSDSRYRVGMMAGFTAELSGQELVAQPGRTCTLVLSQNKAESILTITAAGTGGSIYARSGGSTSQLFFSTRIEPDLTAAIPASVYDVPDYQFSAIAPFMMFFRYAAGERAWHSTRHYANLTIDDALLHEQYGYVRYRELLAEMQKHNFHTTIAFIPWNFDRSEADVVTLFRENPDRFSISIHGNNHDHQEFPALKDRPLRVQAANATQALARMERFRQLTHITYDPVMVFPHSIGPSETLGVLKRDNYLATINSRDVPLDSSNPSNPTFALRPFTLSFATFPSLRRYSAEIAIWKSTLALDAFLGNPLLFYVHQAYFADGEDRFDSIADRVNALVPDINWRGLAEITEHLYFERLRPDGNYDVRAFSGSIRLENTHSKDTIFFVSKDEDFNIPFKLFVDGQPFPYTRNGDSMSLRVPVKAGTSRNVTIQYESGVDLEAVDISKSSTRVAVLRYLSEFRDDVVSRSSIGRRFTQIYTSDESGLNRAMGLGCMVIAAGAAFALRRRKMAHQSRVRTP